MDQKFARDRDLLRLKFVPQTGGIVRGLCPSCCVRGKEVALADVENQ